MNQFPSWLQAQLKWLELQLWVVIHLLFFYASRFKNIILSQVSQKHHCPLFILSMKFEKNIILKKISMNDEARVWFATASEMMTMICKSKIDFLEFISRTTSLCALLTHHCPLRTPFPSVPLFSNLLLSLFIATIVRLPWGGQRSTGIYSVTAL